MRLFTAINFSEEVKEGVHQSVQKLRAASRKGSFTLKENIHLTLVFIGETNKTEAIKEAMDKTAQGLKLSPFYISLGELDKFKRQEGDIYFMAVKKQPNLESLQGRLSQELTAAGFSIEKRPYKAHITLGRRVILKEGISYEELKNSINPIKTLSDSISLMLSDRVNGKLVYREIYRRSL